MLEYLLLNVHKLEDSHQLFQMNCDMRCYCK